MVKVSRPTKKWVARIILSLPILSFIWISYWSFALCNSGCSEPMNAIAGIFRFADLEILYTIVAGLFGGIFWLIYKLFRWSWKNK